jgi:hypothetical protein
MRELVSKCTVALFEGLLINVLILVVALVVLDKASDLTIDNAVKVADVTGSGKTTIGFVLVAFCTSLPALSVSIFSALMITDTHTIHGWISLLKGLGYVKEVNPLKTNYPYEERRITPTPETKHKTNHAQIHVFLKQHAHHEQQVEIQKSELVA